MAEKAEVPKVVIKVKYGGEEIDLDVSLPDFDLATLERWARARFALGEKDRLVFKNNKGVECLPTKRVVAAGEAIVVEVVPPAKPAAKGIDKSGLISFHIPIAIAAIAILVYIFQHAGLVPYLAETEAVLNSGGYFLKKEVMLEAMINGLGWSLMHLFVRRMLNPENKGKWFDGYFLDSCYGGLAACGQTLFKGYFLVTILKRASST